VASNPVIDPPIIWRTKLRSLKPGVDHAKQVAYCIDGGRVGIGWGVEDLPTGTPLADVVAAIRAKKEPGWGPQAASTVRLFGEEAKVNDFIWTRDLEGRFRLAQIAGDYRYDNSAKGEGNGHPPGSQGEVGPASARRPRGTWRDHPSLLRHLYQL
jgi:hypothetical protein